VNNSGRIFHVEQPWPTSKLNEALQFDATASEMSTWCILYLDMKRRVFRMYVCDNEDDYDEQLHVIGDAIEVATDLPDTFCVFIISSKTAKWSIV